MKNTQNKLSSQTFIASAYIKEIGRGKEGARDLSRDDAYQLYSAMLDNRVSDLEMGAILIAMRIKGESIEEIAGFLDAAEAHMQNLQMVSDSQYAPIVIPSYNGARKRANLTPLLAMLLARAGAPVLVHGMFHDPGRVTSAEIFSILQVSAAQTIEQVQQQLVTTNLAFVPIQVLAPAMHRILMMRQVLGLRNSTHTLVKILQPFLQPALHLTSYTHPEYQVMLDRYFRELAPKARGAALLMRGTEGETVASTARAQRIDFYWQGQCETLQETTSQLIAEPECLPANVAASTTADWITNVLDGRVPIPANIEHQVARCLNLSKLINAKN
jgi:anthranilate phosphoribosyltransferase